MRITIAALLIAASTIITGCASLEAPNYSADYSAVDALKHVGLSKTALGKAAPENPDAKVNKVSLRGANLRTNQGTFSAYIVSAMTSDLREAGLFDANSRKRIDLILIKNDIDVSGISEGFGQIEADLSLTESGKTLLRKTYSATTRFESSFAGAVAIPRGQAEYPHLVGALLTTIYRDPEFLRAMQ